MTTRVLVIGGYGNFGTYISTRLAREPNLNLIIAGRSESKAKALASTLNAEWAQIDISGHLDQAIISVRPDILIHTSGPFQGQGYDVAKACIRNRVHYVDLADGREFVASISQLNGEAKKAGVLVVSGASSVPALTSAVIKKYIGEFEKLVAIDYGIATAQKTNRGLATTRAVLSYAGKPFNTVIGGKIAHVYGWQGLTWRKFRNLGWRLLGNCDVPDLVLFPKYFPDLSTIRFRAGLELSLLHIVLWALTWAVRVGVINNLADISKPLLAISRSFDVFGTDDSGFYMEMTGLDAEGQAKRVHFDIAAKAGDGLMIPCTPAVVLVLMLARAQLSTRGAMPCLGLIELDRILEELGSLRINWKTSRF